MNEEELKNYYNKFNEDKRLNTRHGQVEFLTCIKYIESYLKNYDKPKILEIGAGTGKYSGYFADKGYDVTAIELVKHNFRVIEEKHKNVKAIWGNALDLKLESDYYDIVLIFGPLYHLIDNEEKEKALNEAKRVLKKDGTLFAAYIMNDYAIITHGFKENKIIDSINEDLIEGNYHVKSRSNDLYSYVRLDDIDELNRKCDLRRKCIFTPDGPANYIRSTLNKMDDKTFEVFLDYHFNTCERTDMLGASAHIVDILEK